MRRHWALAVSASSCANAVAMKAETTRRPLRPACARALRMKWTRQRCQVAFSTLAIAALMPSCASEITQLDAAQASACELAQERIQHLRLARAWLLNAPPF